MQDSWAMTYRLWLKAEVDRIREELPLSTLTRLRCIAVGDPSDPGVLINLVATLLLFPLILLGVIYFKIGHTSKYPGVKLCKHVVGLA